MSEDMGEKKWVMVDTRDEKGSTWRAVCLTDDGGFAIRGQDLGSGPEGFWGSYEYEFDMKYSRDDTESLMRRLGHDEGESLLDVLARNFASYRDLTGFLDAADYKHEFWSRVGD